MPDTENIDTLCQHCAFGCAVTEAFKKKNRVTHQDEPRREVISYCSSPRIAGSEEPRVIDYSVVSCQAYEERVEVDEDSEDPTPLRTVVTASTTVGELLENIRAILG